MIILYKIVRAALIAYVLFGVLLYAFQREFLYFPTDEVEHEYPVEKISSAGELLDVIVLNPGQPKAIIYFGGNGEIIPHAASAFDSIFVNHTLYLVNYRGYGASTGKPSEQALLTDAENIYDLLKERHETISVIGRSLGSGVATYLAANREIEKLALITPFDSVQSLAQQRYPIYPVAWLLKDKYPAVEWAQKVISPTLVLLAELDFMIPAEHSQRLVDHFLEQLITVKIFKGFSHNNISFMPDYYLELKQFFEVESQVES